MGNLAWELGLGFGRVLLGLTAGWDALDVSRCLSVMLSVIAFAPSVLLQRARMITLFEALMYDLWLVHTLAFSAYTFMANTLMIVSPMSLEVATLWSSLLRNHGVVMAAGYAFTWYLQARQARQQWVEGASG